MTVEYYLRAPTGHQMQRPQLARLIDIAEKREYSATRYKGRHTVYSYAEAISCLQMRRQYRTRPSLPSDVFALTGVVSMQPASEVRVLFRHDWVVYSKQLFGGPEHALCYLGVYTHRVGIANSRLVSFAEGQVSFRWRA